MKLFRTPQVELNKMLFYVFLENSEIRNNSRLLGEPSCLPGDSSALPGELRVQYFFITINKNNWFVACIQWFFCFNGYEIQNWLIYNYIISNSCFYCYFLLLLSLARDWCIVIVVVELWFLKIKFCLSRTQIKRDDGRSCCFLFFHRKHIIILRWNDDGMVNNPVSWWVPSSR